MLVRKLFLIMIVHLHFVGPCKPLFVLVMIHLDAHCDEYDKWKMTLGFLKIFWKTWRFVAIGIRNEEAQGKEIIYADSLGGWSRTDEEYLCIFDPSQAWSYTRQHERPWIHHTERSLRCVGSDAKSYHRLWMLQATFLSNLKISAVNLCSFEGSSLGIGGP